MTLTGFLGTSQSAKVFLDIFCLYVWIAKLQNYMQWSSLLSC